MELRAVDRVTNHELGGTVCVRDKLSNAPEPGLIHNNDEGQILVQKIEWASWVQ